MKWIMSNSLMLSILFMSSSAFLGMDCYFGWIGTGLFIAALIIDSEQGYQNHLDEIADRVNSRRKG